MIELVIPDADAMAALGARLAPLLRAGDLVQLDGELGAGKTTLTRGLGVALGAREAITSPTFVLAREHPTTAGPPLVHVDAYRLDNSMLLEDLDLDFDHSVVVVVWGAGLLDDASESWLEIVIELPEGAPLPVMADAADAEHLGADEPRVLQLRGYGPRWAGTPFEASQ